MGAQPFEVSIPQETLDDLCERLARARWPDEVAGAGWDYGSNLVYMKELTDYWQHGFDWRAQEAKINRFAHFRAEVDGFGIHFIHERGRGPEPIPIILTHGWPDSFYRMLKIIPLLVDPARHGGDPAYSFDVIVPSLPGYGFSDRPTERGMTPSRIADLWARLMTQELGYERFAAQGGDIGSSVTQQLALDYPDSLAGIHLTDVPYLNLVTFYEGASELSEAERKYLEEGRKWGQEEGGYAVVQSTKPQTLAYGLNDSPAGLAAWILEKFRSWSDCDGDVEKRFSKDELLTNLTIYWATETINSSFRVYYEPFHNPPPANAGERVEVPTGFAMFPKDLVPAPREWAERFFNVEHWTQMPRGGHFAAMEEPELLAEDIRAFFRRFR
ncbi:MAG: epoxide hydrolase [Actinomycetota bacterium]|nr:epoxide hydrolase [Actinomycetota bacterium]